jgi:hypothetical protein
MSARSLNLMPLFTVAFCTLPVVLAAQEASDIQTLTDKVDGFFKNLQDEGVNTEDAFRELLADGPLVNPDAEQFTDTIEKYEGLQGLYGPFLAAKRIHAKSVDEDVIYLTFLYKTERFPVVWRFVFYRPPTEAVDQSWFIVRLSFDTKLEQLLTLQ